MLSTTLPVGQYLLDLHARHKQNRSGAQANYIPELTRVDADLFGLSFVTMDGHIYEAGDTGTLFTIQSISKALIYGLALEDHGREAVLAKIGVEPSGEAFNSIAFDERSNRPFNPMVNAGAIAATALVRGTSHAERYARILDAFERYVGRPLAIDEAVYRSESETGHRNRAIAFLELNSGMIDGDVDEHLDLYFRQCSMLVNTVDLAIIGATLANGGLNPVTGERALSPGNVRSVLSVMNTCGMYDYAGGWQFDVGLPAKSGVGGGIAAVLPGHLGIGVFSPRLDAVGNSERGVRVCEDISGNFRLHLFEDRGGGQDPIRRVYRGTEVRSSRVRRQQEVEALDHFGHAIAVIELQGDLSFMEAERVTRRIGSEISSLSYLIVDMSRLRRVDSVAENLLRMLAQSIAETGQQLAIVSGIPRLREIAGDNGHGSVDLALENFEDSLLRRLAEVDPLAPTEVELESFDLLRDWSPEQLAALAAHVTTRTFSTGEVLVEAGAPANELFFLVDGRVNVSIAVEGGKTRRVSTIDAGNVFGELALFGAARRTADVIAASDGKMLELDASGIAALNGDSNNTHLALALAVGKSLADRLGRANREIQALSR
ncbi:glutaminase A [Devosia sp.]|uniref:glutaminase A n=1 Tax=Devosia sp. TaxID=1871048 RepID=UPI003A92F501